jgi:xanthine/uracil permease
VAVAGAAGSLAAGTLEALAGQSTAITKVSTIITPTVLTLWTAVIGVLLYRRATSLASASAAEPDEVSPKALKPTNGAPPAPTLQASRRSR